MTDRVRTDIRQYQLLREGDRVTVGLSGGADSVCLLLCMKAVQEEYRLQLQAVHVHHGLRGEEADRDAAFAESLCRKLAVPFRLRHAPVRELARREGLSLEEAGRILRYQILREESNGGKIAVAHHRDDQSETLLFHMVRGTGIRGVGRDAAGEGRDHPAAARVWAVQRSRCIFSRWGRSTVWTARMRTLLMQETVSGVSFFPGFATT